MPRNKKKNSKAALITSHPKTNETAAAAMAAVATAAAAAGKRRQSISFNMAPLATLTVGAVREGNPAICSLLSTEYCLQIQAVSQHFERGDKAPASRDVFELVGGANREQQRPGQQGVGVELARLGTDERTGTVHPRIGSGEQVLEALHGSVHVLEKQSSRDHL
ncbi:hypothetical protein EYF80_054056 [Liparis tanakae]|uniref:Uncharacterized protein n=1 Tax=Liparis tanakae TaxID=230148 RepID=A0A4Z2F3Q3_9TELE|nr:hypothetical protein EYF80_054056 [Liparis tanakae]